MLVSYRGVVTSTDPLIPSLFTVDKKVRVCPSLLTAVSNIPHVKPGQSVSVHNSHLVKLDGVRWLGKDFMALLRPFITIVIYSQSSESWRRTLR